MIENKILRDLLEDISYKEFCDAVEALGVVSIQELDKLVDGLKSSPYSASKFLKANKIAELQIAHTVLKRVKDRMLETEPIVDDSVDIGCYDPKVIDDLKKSREKNAGVVVKFDQDEYDDLKKQLICL